ncbi:secreted RxLR effector protein 161-like [Cryptomeria japonica]|uniref:secreted RxLR effector protein 161-like n=1 Tax=Cryptomeria japonica TaxID=3369 RepID=UPI0027DA41C1|nr:secreted RxLR effector protein 161-like [Cryptomeria japonica]
MCENVTTKRPSAKSDSPIENESTFRQLVGSLIYLTATRPDLSYVVSYISCFMTTPIAEHWIVVKRDLCYVKGTFDFDILYGRNKDLRLIDYIVLDWAGYVDDKKSTFGYVFSLGTGTVTWTSKKQQAVALSSTKAEYWGTVKTTCEAIWLRRMLSDMQMS